MAHQERKTSPRILVIGIGNPGRKDDGLGAACVKKLSALCLAGVTCDMEFQLRLENAQACSGQDVVIFVDAAQTLGKAFSLTSVKSTSCATVTSHSLRPEMVLAIAEDLYKARPRAYLLAIEGYRWEVGEGLSSKARKNCEVATAALAGFLAGILGNDKSPTSEEALEPVRKEP